MLHLSHSPQPVPQGPLTPGRSACDATGGLDFVPLHHASLRVGSPGAGGTVLNKAALSSQEERADARGSPGSEALVLGAI